VVREWREAGRKTGEQARGHRREGETAITFVRQYSGTPKLELPHAGTGFLRCATEHGSLSFPRPEIEIVNSTWRDISDSGDKSGVTREYREITCPAFGELRAKSTNANNEAETGAGKTCNKEAENT